MFQAWEGLEGATFQNDLIWGAFGAWGLIFIVLYRLLFF